MPPATNGRQKRYIDRQGYPRCGDARQMSMDMPEAKSSFYSAESGNIGRQTSISLALLKTPLLPSPAVRFPKRPRSIVPREDSADRPSPLGSHGDTGKARRNRNRDDGDHANERAPREDRSNEHRPRQHLSPPRKHSTWAQAPHKSAACARLIRHSGYPMTSADLKAASAIKNAWGSALHVLGCLNL